MINHELEAVRKVAVIDLATLGYQLGNFPRAEMLGEQMMSLPVYSELRDSEADYVIDAIHEFFGSSRT